MNEIKCRTTLLALLLGIVWVVGCTSAIKENTENVNREPLTEPDYTGVTVPCNIAPLNFLVKEDGQVFQVTATDPSGKVNISITSKNGIIRFPVKKWKKLTEASRGNKIKVQVISVSKGSKNATGYRPFFIHVSPDSIDSYLVYRVIHPGYYSWSNLKIVQRSLENFEEESVIENQVIEKNCVNCHSFSQNNPGRYLVHVRGSKGGTYFVDDEKITRTDLKTEQMPGGATYPAWHPGGRFVAFSSNQVRQNFYAHAEKSIEVYDLVSTLILYDTRENEIISITRQDSATHLETFPTWSPDGKFLYFCTATQNEAIPNMDMADIKNLRYSLARIPFDTETRSFGETSVVLNASELNKSISFPRISPDGKFLAVTLHDFGTFPIWHQEADLYLFNLINGDWAKMDINSENTESYHTWSSNGRWMVFSSKRLDGRSSRPFFAHIDSAGVQGKPFVLPQKDPAHYNRMLESFNIPELVSGKIKTTPRQFVTAAKQDAIQANSGDPENMPKWMDNKTNEKRPDIEKGIHE